MTFEAVAAKFIERYAKQRNRHWKDVQSIFRRSCTPRWGERPMDSIRRREIADLLDELVVEGKPYAARHTRAALSKLFAWWGRPPGVEFVARSAFFFSSILVPSLRGQDRSRIAFLELGMLADRSPPVMTRQRLAELGRQLRARLISSTSASIQRRRRSRLVLV